MLRSFVVTAAAVLLVDAGCAHPAGPSSPVEPPAAETPPPLSDATRARVEADLRPLDNLVKTTRETLARDAGDPHDREWVKRQLKGMVTIDQRIRGTLMQVPPGYGRWEGRYFVNQVALRMLAEDPVNTRALKAILAVHDWIKLSAFGPDAEHDAWVLVQHADADGAFQREVLARLEPLVAEGEASARTFALLSDRVAVAEKRPQRFGTQGHCSRPGLWQPYPIEDAPAVDERRKGLGLAPMALYAADVGRQCTAAMPP